MTEKTIFEKMTSLPTGLSLVATSESFIGTVVSKIETILPKESADFGKYFEVGGLETEVLIFKSEISKVLFRDNGELIEDGYDEKTFAAIVCSDTVFMLNETSGMLENRDI